MTSSFAACGWKACPSIGVDLNRNRSYTYAHIRTADGSHVALVDCRLVRGLDRKYDFMPSL